MRGVRVAAWGAWAGRRVPGAVKWAWLGPRGPYDRKGGVEGSEGSVAAVERPRVRGVHVAARGAVPCPRDPCGCEGAVAGFEGFVAGPDVTVLPQGALPCPRWPFGHKDGVAASDGTV